ncbi:M23 family metallopeptidase [bacterium]|nr:M23 family metallopeptidase [bacterium]
MRGWWGSAACSLLALTLGVGCGSSRVAPEARVSVVGVRSAPRPKLAKARFGGNRDIAAPNAERSVPVAPTDGLALAPLERAPVEQRPKGAPKLTWPLSGPVTSQYGRRGRRHHDGIDIGAAPGTGVRAAASGTVAYAGSVRGYGRMIIILHDGGFATVYAHNARQHVRAGARVRRGDLIATVGRSGRTTGPNLHFEVRRHNVAYDPLALLALSDARVAQGE